MSRLRRPFAFATVLLTAAGVAVLSAPGEAGASRLAKSHTLKVIQYNLADGTECHPHGAKCLTTLKKAIHSSRPDLVMLEEVCSKDVPRLRSAYPKWSFHFARQTKEHKGCDSSPKGNVLASPYRIDHVGVHKLPKSYHSGQGYKRFTLMCGVAHLPGAQVHACVTHLRADGRSSYRSAEIARIVKILDPLRHRGARIVLAGDFNTDQRKARGRATLRPIENRFVETDRADRQATHGRSKLDYIWYSIPHVSVKGTVGPAGRSDHHLLRGTATFRA